MTDRETARQTARDLERQLQDKAFGERRLGLLILDNKDGAALAAGIPHFTAAAGVWRQLQWPAREAEVLMDLARLHDKAGHASESAPVWAEALRLFDGARDERAIDAAKGAGASLLACGRAREAIVPLERGAVIADDRNDHLRQAEVRLELCRVWAVAGQPATALDLGGKALATFDAFRKHLLIAACHEALAVAHDAAGAPEAAAAAYAKAAQLHQELARPGDAGEVLLRLAAWRKQRGERVHAAEALRQAALLFSNSGKPLLEARALRRLGTVLAESGDGPAAHTALSLALERCRAVADAHGIARTLLAQADACAKGGDLPLALVKLQEAEAAAAPLQDPHLEEPILASLARLQRQSGDHAAALLTMRRWVDVLKLAGDREAALRILGEMADVHQERGAWDEAEAHLARLADVCRTPADATARARALLQLAVVAARKGAHGAALGHLADAAATVPADAPRDLALAIHAQLGHTGLMQVSTLITQGAPKSKARTPLAHLETALALAESLGDANAKARILVDLGNARALLGEDDTAMALFDQATALAETQGEMRQTMVLRRKPAGG